MKILQMLALLFVVITAINLWLWMMLSVDLIGQFINQYLFPYRGSSDVQFFYLLISSAGLYILTVLDRPLHLRKKSTAPRACCNC